MSKCIAVALVLMVITIQANIQDSLLTNVPDINIPQTNAVVCSSVDDLLQAHSEMLAGNTRNIVLTDGTYDLTTRSGFDLGLRIAADGSSITSQSRDPEKVTIISKGFTSTDLEDEAVKIEAGNITLAYITIKDVRANGLKIQETTRNVMVHNVYFVDICERGIKVPLDVTATDVTVQYCLFEQITSMSEVPNPQMNGDYIAGMDIMKARNWRVHHNVFKNIQGTNGAARGGVFYWRDCQNMVTENNLFINCDRALSYGNTAGDNNVNGGIIRNNYIIKGVESAFEIIACSDVKVYNNSVYSPDFPSLSVKLESNGSGNEIKNNILMGSTALRSGTMPDTASNLIVWSQSGYKDFSAYDLRLSSTATAAIDAGLNLAEVQYDFSGNPRDEYTDIGAAEYEYEAPEIISLSIVRGGRQVDFMWESTVPARPEIRYGMGFAITDTISSTDDFALSGTFSVTGLNEGYRYNWEFLLKESHGAASAVFDTSFSMLAEYSIEDPEDDTQLFVPGITVSPNPFNPTTVITVSGIPAGDLSGIHIYDSHGRIAAEPHIAAQTRGAGPQMQYRWDASGMPAGIYTIVAKTAPGRSLTKKLVLVK
ncbi:MAG: hypothetical protein ACLFQK_05750 [Fibrobacterota bacterium]